MSRTPARRVLVLLLAAAGSTVGAATPGSQPASESPIALRQGSVHEREIAGGGAHSYDISLIDQEYLHIVVAANGINVAIVLEPPLGDSIEVNLVPDPVGPERLTAIAPASGSYRVVVKAVSATAPPGRYTVRVEEVRQAAAEDEVRVRARRRLETAWRLTRGEVSEWKEAVPIFAEVRELFASIGDAAGEAEAVYQSALVAMDLAEPGALDLALDALARFRGFGDEFYIGKTLNILCAVHLRRGELNEAIEVGDQARAIHQRLGNASQEVILLSWLGSAYGRRGEPERAIVIFQDAERIGQRMGYASSAGVFNNLAIASKDLGDFPLSLSYYEKALSLARAAKETDLQATILTNMGNLHRRRGDHQRALALYEEALPIAVTSGTRVTEARTLNTMGLTLYRLGQYERALALHEQSLAMRRSVMDTAAEAASLNGAGLALHALGRSDEAAARLDEALAIRRRTSDRLGEANTLHDLAMVARDNGDLPAARAHMEAALEVTDQLRGQIMSRDSRASFIAAEHDRHELYVDILMQLHAEQPNAGFDRAALGATESGRARVLRESLIEARADIRQGVAPALLEEERAIQRDLDAASTRLSRALTRTSDQAAVSAARTALADAMNRHDDVQGRIRRESPAYAALTQPSAPEVAALQRDAVDEHTLLLEYSLGEKRSWLWAVTPDDVLSVELPPRDEIEAVARRVYDALGARQPRDGESASARSARVARADGALEGESRALSRMILQPVAERLGPAWRNRRLVIVADGILQFLPFAALPDPVGNGRALVADHEIVYLPSAGVLSEIRSRGPKRITNDRTIAIVADPVFEAEDSRLAGGVQADARAARSSLRGTADSPGVNVEARALRSLESADRSRPARLARLPFTRQEARAIARLAPRQPLQATDFRATRGAVLAPALANYRYVHLATHGIFNSNQPELSGLVFSLLDERGKAIDGFLRLNDIYNMRLDADLVVLSACQTALGAEVRGEGLVGLTRGFMYAGARRIVASLWQVDDQSTVELMRRFYAGMLSDGLSPAASLQRAQREMAGDPRWSSPFHWAAFVLQGEWR